MNHNDCEQVDHGCPTCGSPNVDLSEHFKQKADKIRNDPGQRVGIAPEADALQDGREKAALDIEAEARAYEDQFGIYGRGSEASAVLWMAARIARGGR